MASYFDKEIRPEVLDVLSNLRRRIKQYVFFEGIALVVAVIGALFWISLFVDWAWFEMSKFELPIWFRQAYGVLAVVLFVSGIVVWVVLRTIKQMRRRALALVLERRFPELDDRLITAVEVSDSLVGNESPLTLSMINRTVEEISGKAKSIGLGDVFDKKPLVRALVVSTVLVASIVGFGLTNAQAMNRWVNAFLRYQDIYWDRDTELVVKVLDQNDRERDFPDDQTIKHPSGNDLTFIIEVPEKNADGKELIVPEKVSVRYRYTSGGGTKRETAMRFGERRFKFSIAKVMENLELWVIGGDFKNRKPYKIQAVDPPRVDELSLNCIYPAYTGMNQDTSVEKLKQVQGTHVSVPMETRFILGANTNKTIENVRLQYGNTEISFGYFIKTNSDDDDADDTEETREFRATMRVSTPGTNDEQIIDLLEISGEPKKYLRQDRTYFEIPVILSAEKNETVRARNKQPITVVDPVTHKENVYRNIFVMPPDSDLRIYLEDSDGIFSSDPGLLTIGGEKDEAPQIEASLIGIGLAVTPIARIPVTATVKDKYGLRIVEFQYRVSEASTKKQPVAKQPKEPQWLSYPLVTVPQDDPKKFQLQLSKDQNFEYLPVRALKLHPGQLLTLTVFAQDGDDLNGPHQSRSNPEFKFRVVDEFELLAILYERQVQLFERFGQIITELEETQAKLTIRRGQASQRDILKGKAANNSLSAEEQNKLVEFNDEIRLEATRSMSQVNKNRNESIAVEEGFRQILAELINNSIPQKEISNSLKDLIVGELVKVNGKGFSAVTNAIAEYSSSEEETQIARIDTCVTELGALIEHMRRIQKEMDDLVKYQKAIQDFKRIMEAQDDLIDKTKLKRQDDLNGPPKSGKKTKKKNKEP